MDTTDQTDETPRRVRARRRDAASEWMALMTPGWRPAPLSVDEARAFMARD